MRTNGEAIFVLVNLSSASHHQLQSLSSAKQNQNSEKSQQGTFFDAAEPVGNKHATQASITAEGARPTTPQNQHRSLPFSYFSCNNLYVLFTPSLGRVRRPCRGLEKFFPPVLQRCYGCNFDAQEIVHTGHGMLGFFLFLLERKVPAQSKLKE